MVDSDRAGPGLRVEDISFRNGRRIGKLVGRLGSGAFVIAALNPDPEARAPLIGGVTDPGGLFQSLEHPVETLPADLVPIAQHAQEELRRFEQTMPDHVDSGE